MRFRVMFVAILLAAALLRPSTGSPGTPARFRAKSGLSSLALRARQDDEADSPGKAQENDVKGAMGSAGASGDAGAAQSNDQSGGVDQDSLSQDNSADLEATQEAAKEKADKDDREARDQVAEASLEEADSGAEELASAAAGGDEDEDEDSGNNAALEAAAAEETGEVDPADDQKAALENENQSAGKTGAALQSVEAGKAAADGDDSGDAPAGSGGSASAA